MAKRRWQRHLGTAFTRRTALAFLAAMPGVTAAVGAPQTEDPWGADLGYPVGWGPAGEPPRWEAYTQYRVGNFSGGFEAMFRHNRIEPSPPVSRLVSAPRKLSYEWRGRRRTVEDFLSGSPVTGFLIARKGEVWCEEYRMQRRPDMRFQSWSMAKSVTSLLLGIALDRGMVRSIDDTPDFYVPALRGTLHGGIAMRHLLNMSSGVEVQHERDPVRIDVPALLGWPPLRAQGTDVDKVVRDWTEVREAPGTRFNYNELCPLTIGIVLRAVSGDSLAGFAARHLWPAIGAEAAATWLTDVKGREYNCVGFGATLRDWARLAQMIAQGGRMEGRMAVSPAWLNECTRHGAADRASSFGVMRPDMGYRNFFWLPRADGRWLMMNGAHGQRVVVDRSSETVLVHMSVSQEGRSQEELLALFGAVAGLPD